MKISLKIKESMDSIQLQANSGSKHGFKGLCNNRINILKILTEMSCKVEYCCIFKTPQNITTTY